MKNLLLSVGLALAFLLVPTLAFAADGDECMSHTGNAAIPKFTSSNWTELACIQVCDDKEAADSSCTEYDFNDAPGMPDLVIFEYEEDPANMDCSGTPDYTITTGPITGGTPSYDLDTSAVILNPTTNRIIVDVSQSIPDRFLFFSIADDAACTNVDVRMFLRTKNQGFF